MYLSAERLALANQAVRETFEQCSIVWQAIPHWETGDPGQIRVADGIVNKPGFLPLDPKEEKFQLTLAQATSPTPDSLLAEVMAVTKDLAKKVDGDVLQKLYTKAPLKTITTATITPVDLQDPLIDARVAVENAGYRAPSCLVTNTAGLKKLNEFVSGYYSVVQQLLLAANINALHRSEPLDPPDSNTRLVLIGRRRRIPQGAAAEASPGEEPVDLAVSLLPSLEIVGETSKGEIELSARIRYATRITDATGLFAIKHA
jgi:hypothetical protein